MTTLAVYQDHQLQLPTKVLTHDEDVLPLLTTAGVGLQRLESGLPDRSELDRAGAAQISGELLDRFQVKYAREFAEVMELEGPPGYLEESATQQRSEEVLAGDSLWLFLDGYATVCIHYADKLLVLGCRRGDLLELPAGLAHWVTPAAATRCLIVRHGRDAQALVARPTGSDIASRYLVLEF